MSNIYIEQKKILNPHLKKTVIDLSFYMNFNQKKLSRICLDIGIEFKDSRIYNIFKHKNKKKEFSCESNQLLPTLATIDSFIELADHLSGIKNEIINNLESNGYIGKKGIKRAARDRKGNGPLF